MSPWRAVVIAALSAILHWLVCALIAFFVAFPVWLIWNKVIVPWFGAPYGPALYVWAVLWPLVAFSMLRAKR